MKTVEALSADYGIPDWLAACVADAPVHDESEGEGALAIALRRHPERLPDIAAMAGLHALAPEAVLAADCDFEILPLSLVLEWRILPIRVEGVLYLALGCPDSLAARNRAAHLRDALARKGIPGELALTAGDAAGQRLQMIEAQERAIDQFRQDDSEGGTDADAVVQISLSSIGQDQNPVVKLLNSTLFDAVQSRASDIHLESTAGGLAIKYRIDGVLQAITQANGADFAEQSISRIKVLGAMDIGERRVPQDGRFKARIQSRDIDFRVSVMPSIHGEDAVLRVLDKSSQNQSIRLETLGFDGGTLERIRGLVRIPHGMVLVTGPTGSGKSTTLYATLAERNSGEEKLITIEDPVEYQLQGVLQIPVNDKKGLTFAAGLRAILRHDPDIIMVGEIRDAQTAGIAVQAALTGHLVLSSVHANGVFSVLERFMYMQVEPASLLEALGGIVAQRLVRRICKSCGGPKEGAEATGCEACRSTGYHGRIALAEVLHCSEAFKEAALRKGAMRELKAIAKAEGFISMHEAAMAAVRLGQTTLQEVRRVVASE
jgi:general secretion pathway protein E